MKLPQKPCYLVPHLNSDLTVVWGEGAVDMWVLINLMVDGCKLGILHMSSMFLWFLPQLSISRSTQGMSPVCSQRKWVRNHRAPFPSPLLAFFVNSHCCLLCSVSPSPRWTLGSISPLDCVAPAASGNSTPNSTIFSIGCLILPLHFSHSHLYEATLSTRYDRYSSAQVNLVAVGVQEPSFVSYS